MNSDADRLQICYGRTMSSGADRLQTCYGRTMDLSADKLQTCYGRTMNLGADRLLWECLDNTSGHGDGMLPRPKVYYGWYIAWSYFFMNFYWGGALLAGFSALFIPIRESFGLTATLLAVAISLRYGMAVFGSPVVGYVFDRRGPRSLMLFATLATVGGLLLLIISQSILLLFISFTIASIGFAIYIAGTGPAVAANWFVRQRGRAIGIVLAGGGFGGPLVSMVVWLEGEWGWRTALAIIVAGLMIVGIPGSLILRHKPEQYGLKPDGDPPQEEDGGQPEHSATMAQPTTESDVSVEQALKTRALWFIISGFVIVSLGSGAMNLLFIPHLVDQGFSPTTAGWTFTAMGTINIGTTLMVGWVSDMLDRRRLIIASYLMQGGSLAIFAFATELWHLVPFVVLFALGPRVSLLLVSSLLADYFGRSHFGKIQSVLFSGFTAANVMGPVVAGVVHDATGSYTLVFAGYGASAVLAVLVTMLVSRPPTRSLPPPIC